MLRDALLWLTVTLVVYLLMQWFYKRMNKPMWLLPVITSTLLISGLLWLSGVPVERYSLAVNILDMLLQPVVVLLAVPVYIHLKTLRRDLPEVMGALIVGSLSSVASVLVLAWALDLAWSDTLSALPKSVTSPVSMPLAHMLGGMSLLAGGLSIITGIIGTPMVLLCARWFALSDAQTGVLMGLNAHAVGSAKAVDMGTTCLAYSAFSMGAASLMFTLAVLGINATTGGV